MLPPISSAGEINVWWTCVTCNETSWQFAKTSACILSCCFIPYFCYRFLHIVADFQVMLRAKRRRSFHRRLGLIWPPFGHPFGTACHLLAVCDFWSWLMLPTSKKLHHCGCAKFAPKNFCWSIIHCNLIIMLYPESNCFLFNMPRITWITGLKHHEPPLRRRDFGSTDPWTDRSRRCSSKPQHQFDNQSGKSNQSHRNGFVWK